MASRRWPRRGRLLGVTSGATADGRAITIARFESEAVARTNSERPEQGAWWAETAKYYDGDAVFTETSDVEEFLGGGSNDAGFVQVMKSHDVDRDAMVRMDRMFEKHALRTRRHGLIQGIDRHRTCSGQCCGSLVAKIGGVAIAL